MINIKIIIGSTREGRFGEKPAQWIFEELKKQEDVDVEILDLRDYPMPFFDSPMPSSMAGGKYSHETVQKWAGKINEANAFIIVTPEYNHGYSAVLKNALDWLYPEWNKKAVGFISYGSAVGARAVEQLRQVVIELQMVPIRNSIHIPVDIFMKAMMSKEPTGLEIFQPVRESAMGDRMQIFIDDLLWTTKTLQGAK